MNRRRLFKALAVAPVAVALGIKLASQPAKPVTGNYQGISRADATNEFWEGTVSGGHGGALTEEMWLRAARMRRVY